MKKYVFILLGGLMFLGCAHKVVDPCVAKKQICLSECKISYPDEGFKYKACEAKCYTIYTGCKAKEKIKKGYEKITE